MLKIIGKVFDIILTLFVVYFVICYINILMHNISDANYPAWNLFAQMVLNSPAH